jgi:short-subunit dehydrogenase
MSRNVLITGASSGIGRALALRYAQERGVLGLLGRNGQRLEEVAAECREIGARVHTALVDVRDRNGIAKWLVDFDRAAPVDLVIANAGVMAGTPPAGEIEPPDEAHALIETNMLGVLNTVQPLIPLMTARGRGQIVIMSSLAAFVPLPDCPSYSASKSAVLSYGLSLRAVLEPRGIGVSVVCPGYVTTPMMLRESGFKPFEMAPDSAAALIFRAVDRNRAVIAFPFLLALVTRFAGLCPDPVRRWLLLRSRFTVSEQVP